VGRLAKISTNDKEFVEKWRKPKSGAERRCIMILGLTGGIGCGKSTAAQKFVALGFHLVDSDALIRNRVLQAPAVIRQICARYGDAILMPGGMVNRSVLAARVFGDDRERVWLEALTHPILFGIWREELASVSVRRWIFEVPLLFEQGLENWFDFTICVASSEDQQIVRLEQRGLSRGLAEQRIAKQLPLARKVELADKVLWNDGTLSFLHAQIDTLVGSLPN
jgi:dephospho-CoA kinase